MFIMDTAVLLALWETRLSPRTTWVCHRHTSSNAHACMKYAKMKHTKHTRFYKRSTRSNTDGYPRKLLVGLDLQWPVSLQLFNATWGPVLQLFPRAPIGFQLAGERQPCSRSITQCRKAAGTLGPQLGGEEREGGGQGGEAEKQGSWQ